MQVYLYSLYQYKYIILASDINLLVNHLRIIFHPTHWLEEQQFYSPMAKTCSGNYASLLDVIIIIIL